jgi:6-hydroxycyclohex-1-ene-1-carbonyl-CoA dehydrogenase
VEDLRVLGTAAGQTTAFGLLVHGATLSVVGFTMDKVELRLSNLMAFDARALGNWGCPPELYPPRSTSCSTARCASRPSSRRIRSTRSTAVFDAVHRREITRRAVMVP